MVKFEFLGKLKGDDEEAEEGNSIEEQVEELSNQGYSQHEITEELRDKGYAYSEINQAMNKVIRDSATRRDQQRDTSSAPDRGEEQRMEGGFDDEMAPAGGIPGQEQGQEFEEPDRGRRESPGMQDEEEFREPAPEPSGQPERDMDRGYPDEEEFDRGGAMDEGEDYPEDDWSPTVGIGSDEEALIETIIEEKLIDIDDEFQNLYEELDELIERVDDIEQRVHDLETRKDEDEKEFIQRVSDIEEYMEESQSRIGGLEKAFQQTLPSLVENVRDLTDLVKDMKK